MKTQHLSAAITAGLLVAKHQAAARRLCASERERSTRRGNRRATLILVGVALVWWCVPTPRALLGAASAALATPRFRGECLLAELPNVQTDAVANAIIARCHRLYPPRPPGMPPRESYPNPHACIQAKGLATASETAAAKIIVACSKLYS